MTDHRLWLLGSAMCLIIAITGWATVGLLAIGVLMLLMGTRADVREHLEKVVSHPEVR